MALTPPQRRALEIVRACGPIGGVEFAKLMWPKFNELGANRRRGYNWCTASLLDRLHRRGLLDYVEWSGDRDYPIEYELSNAGAAALDAVEAQATEAGEPTP